VTLVLRDLSPGTYAVSAYHDLDANSQLNNNLMGLPVEPYGFANLTSNRLSKDDNVDDSIDPHLTNVVNDCFQCSSLC
jgi:uncharacterized protein (DUF2141 family)